MKELMDKKIDAVVFDLDGTLIHSTIDFSSMNNETARIMSQFGTPDHIVKADGTINSRLINARRYFLDHNALNTSLAMEKEINSVMSEIEMRRVSFTKEISGARKCIESLLRNGYSVTILTRGSRSYSLAALEAAGLNRLFRNMVCRDDYPVEEAKPNPISMIRAAKMLNTAPDRCLFIGDHWMDMECAEASGACFIGVLSGALDEQGWHKLAIRNVVEDVTSLPELLRIR